jgi:2-polyprenyl-3-methyl-5-hydroxy-6-metoxy-1,4-benzoquinol methylase
MNESHLGGYGTLQQSEHGDPYTFNPDIWTEIIKTFEVKSVLDVGCGLGFSVRWFKEQGLDVLGIEGSSQAIKDSVCPENIIQWDYTIGKLELDKKFDLIHCCEFVEHVEEQYVDNFLDTFKHGRYILMTHAIPNQPGIHHVNCRTSKYWVEKMNKIGYAVDEKTSMWTRIYSNSPYYQNSGLVFERIK